MTGYRKGILLMAVLSTGFIFGCSEPVGPSVAEHSDSLIVHPGAKNVKFFKHKGTDQLAYQLNEKYPASVVIGSISKKLEEKGWKPLPYSYLDPQLPSAHVEGWRKFVDATKPTEQIVHSWAADWTDRSENIVTYMFAYKYPKDAKPNLENLEVIAIYTPAALAKQGREAFQKFKEEFDRQQRAK